VIRRHEPDPVGGLPDREPMALAIALEEVASGRTGMVHSPQVSRRRNVRLLRLACVLGVLAVITVLPAPPASAAVTSDVDGTFLQVWGDADANTVDITCEGGDVKVNGSDPDNGSLACDALMSLVVRGRGGADALTLEHVDQQVDFPELLDISLLGQAGDDTLVGSRGRDFLYGQGGSDTISGRSGADAIDPGVDGGSVDGGPGQDALRLELGGREWHVTDASVQRTSPDPIEFSMTSVETVELRTAASVDAPDRIDASAFGGTLYLTTYGGNDRVLGGSGRDLIVSRSGADRLFGTRGDDVTRGGGGRDLLRGGEGNDLLIGGPGFDRCNGGRGRDTYRGCEAIPAPLES